MTLSTAQTRFAAYYVTGWGTEASKTKSPYVFTPAFTKTVIENGVTKTIAGGISLGVLQIDLSQRPGEANTLQAAYSQWAAINNKPAITLAR